MPLDPVTRRGFFTDLLTAGVAGVARLVTSTAQPLRPPRQAWVIAEVGWENNDEFTFAEGAFPRTQLYFDKAQIDSECERLCAEFFATETPAEFEVDFATYFDEATCRDFDEHAVCWEALRERGFPDPFYVLELDANEMRGAP